MNKEKIKEIIEQMKSELNKLQDDENFKELYANLQNNVTELENTLQEEQKEESPEEESTDESTEIEASEETSEESAEESTEESTEESAEESEEKSGEKEEESSENESQKVQLDSDKTSSEEQVIELQDTDEQTDIELAKWSTQYINDLPDSAFVIIEPAYEEGETENKNARHLPYKDKEGNVDLPHLRNALARVNQVEPVTDSISKEELRNKAEERLQKLKKEYLSEEDVENMQELSANVAQKLNEAREAIEAKDKVISTYEQQVTELQKELDAYKEQERLELQKKFDEKVNGLIELYNELGVNESKENIENTFSENQIDKVKSDLQRLVQSKKKETTTPKPKRETTVNTDHKKTKKEEEQLTESQRASMLLGLQ